LPKHQTPAVGFGSDVAAAAQSEQASKQPLIRLCRLIKQHTTKRQCGNTKVAYFLPTLIAITVLVVSLALEST